MSVISMPADSSTLVLNGRAITDFASGDIIQLNPANPATAHTNSTNGGVNINKRSDANVYDLVIRVQRLSGDDAFLNNALHQEEPVLFNGSCKEDFNRDGTDSVESWILEDGSITTQPSSVKNDQDGNNLSEYTIRFRNASRNL